MSFRGDTFSNNVMVIYFSGLQPDIVKSIWKHYKFDGPKLKNSQYENKFETYMT